MCNLSGGMGVSDICPRKQHLCNFFASPCVCEWWWCVGAGRKCGYSYLFIYCGYSWSRLELTSVEWQRWSFLRESVCCWSLMEKKCIWKVSCVNKKIRLSSFFFFFFFFSIPSIFLSAYWYTHTQTHTHYISKILTINIIREPLGTDGDLLLSSMVYTPHHPFNISTSFIFTLSPYLLIPTYIYLYHFQLSSNPPFFYTHRSKKKKRNNLVRTGGMYGVRVLCVLGTWPVDVTLSFPSKKIFFFLFRFNQFFSLWKRFFEGNLKEERS